MPEPVYGSVAGIPQPDGSTEWWKLTDAWNLLRTDPPVGSLATDIEVVTAIADHSSLPNVHHSQEHSHPTHGDINFTGTVSADGDAGLTGEKTLGGFKFTFKKGLLTGFEPI